MKYHHRPEDPEESSSPKLLIALACRGEQCKAPAQLPTAKFQSRQAPVPMDTTVKQTRDFRIQR